ncbi:MAG: hypothetical protein ACYSWZ_08415 [Planctomycetota bacterium]|jgi:hypothetical protein
MSILTVNLKHLYQRRGLWLAYVVLGFLVFVCIAAPFKEQVEQGRFTWLILLTFVIGLIAAMLPIEVLSKPFSYCLPGHRKIPRKYIFCLGIVFNFFGSLLFLRYPGLNSVQLLLVVCSAFFAGLISYLLGVAFAFGITNSVAFVGFLLLVIVGGGFFGLYRVLERAIVGIPFGIVLVGFLSSIVAWIWLGNEDWARKYCAVPWIGFFDVWNRDKMQRYRQVRAAAKWDKLKQHPNPWVETFFLGRMNRYDYFSANRYIWGAFYTTFGIALSQISQWMAAFSFLLWVCFYGYIGFGLVNMLFILPVLMISQMRLPVYSSMLISGGRNERYRCAMTLVITTAVLITILVTIVAALSLPLATIMPDITLQGRTFTFHAMDIRLFFIPLLMIPLIFTVQLIFYRKMLYMMILFMLIMLICGLPFLPSMILYEHLSSGITQIFIIGGLILCWSTFLFVSRYICMKRNLAGKV